MSGSQFDGGAAFSGGDFMPPQATQTTEHVPATLSKKTEKSDTLIPLTVKQISTVLSNDDKENFLIDGVDRVKLVGMIMNKSERVNDASFVIDDGTGRIDCIKWLTEPTDTKEIEALAEGTYVRVHAQLKAFHVKNQLLIVGIKPVVDFDEITHHFVECIYVHAYNTKLLKQQAGSSRPPSGVHPQAYQTAPSNQFAGQHDQDELTEIDRMVMIYLQKPTSLEREEGVHVDELAMQLGVPLEKIKVVIGSLEETGKVYSTIDYDHYKYTGND